jgi:hypothetical protein
VESTTMTSTPFESPTSPPVTSTPSYVCHVCGENESVGNSGALVNVPNFGVYTCVGLNGAGTSGDFPEADCAAVQDIAREPCGCTNTMSDPSPTPPSPVEFNATTNDTVEPTAAPSVCRICGENSILTNPNGTVSIPNQPNITCSELVEEADAGMFTQNQCLLLQPFVDGSCGCEFVCPVCGEGNNMTNPDGVLSVPGQPNRTCTELIDSAAAGNINRLQCGTLQSVTNEPCGCMRLNEPSAVPSDMPSLVPTRIGVENSPTAVPTVVGTPEETPELTFDDDCYDDLTDIYFMERDVEDASILRKYVLCPDTTYKLGVISETGEINGQPPIQLRPNVVYQCGRNGRQADNCILDGGDFGLTSFYGVFEGIYETVDNVEIRGLTFRSQKMFSAVMEAAGDIVFIDCAFLVSGNVVQCNSSHKPPSFLTFSFTLRLHQNQGNFVPILLQWEGDAPPGLVGIDEAIPAIESGSRNLRTALATPSASQKFYKGQSQRSGNSLSEEEVQSMRERTLQDKNLTHVVTFKDCAFRVSVFAFFLRNDKTPPGQTYLPAFRLLLFPG